MFALYLCQVLERMLTVRIIWLVEYFQLIKQIFVHLHPVARDVVEADSLGGATVVALH